MTDETLKRKITLPGLKKLFKLYRYIKPYRWTYALGLLFLLGSSAASLVFPKLLGELVDYGNKGQLTQEINRIAMILIGVLIAQSVFSYFRIVLFVNVAEKTLADLRQSTFNHLVRLPMKFFQQRRVGELNSRISADITLLQDALTTTLAEFIRQIIIITGGVALMMVTSMKLTLFMLMILPLIMVLAGIFGRYIRKLSKLAQAQVADSNTIVEETLQGIQSVKAFTNEYFEMGRYKVKTLDIADTGIRNGKLRGAFSAFIILGLFGAITAVIWKGANLLAAGEIATGELFSFVIYTVFIGGTIGGMADVFARVQKFIGATEDLLEIFNETPEPVENLPELTPEQILQGGIRFEHLSFSYPSRKDQQVLNDINIDIKPDSLVALVGPSGAGKSTLVSLLLRLYEPTSGRILFDEICNQQIPLSVLRSQMAIVPQDIFLFGGSIRENIAYGKPHASEDQIEDAARKANAWEFIQKFPGGMDTLVGERGTQLSGGQRQRVAIARAVLKNPKILILDEATSSLDSESERLVQDALEKLMKGRTSIVIAHRLSTIRQADLILVLDHGHIVEKGTHEELLKSEEGLYRSLSELQFGA
ncbi:MAG: ABC transporter transmembrane domain-containing protein [Lentimicrobium sp.]|jgi:ABC transporter fused permease/ATP-binding protein|nr:ABC transporter transmembrane domain-containing protein [Lentimicrobium sp.]